MVKYREVVACVAKQMEVSRKECHTLHDDAIALEEGRKMDMTRLEEQTRVVGQL
jgi:hypothetical protein